MSVTDTDQQQQEGGDGHKDGRVVSIAGPVVDVEFPPGDIPEINTAITMSVAASTWAESCSVPTARCRCVARLAWSAARIVRRARISPCRPCATR